MVKHETTSALPDDNMVSIYFDQVQRLLNEMGETPALSQEEQDAVLDFAGQEFDARHCSKLIADRRRAASSA